MTTCANARTRGGAVVEAWPADQTERFVGHVHEVPGWQMLMEVVNHGTQHRAEAAALPTAEGRSPASSPMNYAEEQARVAGREP